MWALFFYLLQPLNCFHEKIYQVYIINFHHIVIATSEARAKLPLFGRGNDNIIFLNTYFGLLLISTYVNDMQ